MSSLPTTEFPPVLSNDDLPLTTLAKAVAVQGTAVYGSTAYGAEVTNTTARTTTYSIPIPSTTFRNGTVLRITGVWSAAAGSPTPLVVNIRVGPSNSSPSWVSVGYTIVDDPYAFIDVTARLRANPTPAASTFNAVICGVTQEQENGLQPWVTLQGYTINADDAVWMTVQWTAADPTNTAYGVAITVEVLQPTL